MVLELLVEEAGASSDRAGEDFSSNGGSQVIISEETIHPGSLTDPLISGLPHTLVGVSAEFLLVLVNVV